MRAERYELCFHLQVQIPLSKNCLLTSLLLTSQMPAVYMTVEHAIFDIGGLKKGQVNPTYTDPHLLEFLSSDLFI